jgi:hypothetical protein
MILQFVIYHIFNTAVYAFWSDSVKYRISISTTGPTRCTVCFHFITINSLYVVKVTNQLDATKYAVLLPQHVSGTNIPIIRSTINKQLPFLGGRNWKIYAK